MVVTLVYGTYVEWKGLEKQRFACRGVLDEPTMNRESMAVSRSSSNPSRARCVNFYLRSLLASYILIDVVVQIRPG
jgi:hypothetical protein